MPATATPAQLFGELRRLARQRRPAPAGDVADLLTRLLGGCALVTFEERANEIAIRLGGPAALTVTCFISRPPPVALTRAEQSVARELCAGRTRAQIAVLRGVTPNTVKSQIRQIFRKLDIESRLDLVRVLGP